MEEIFAVATVLIPRLDGVTTGLAAGWSRLAAIDAASDRARWILTFLPVAAVMLATTNYGPIFFIDGAAAFHPAWHLVHHGHLYVEDLPLRIFAFVDGRGDHLFSNRTPGLIAAAVPMYAALPFGDRPTGIPAAITTSLLCAASIATLRLILDQILSRRLALYGAIVAGFGTSLWSVAGAELLPHAPDVFWLTAAVWFLLKRQNLLVGLALMAAITTRPHLSVVALVLGLWAGWERRSLRPVLSIGAPAFAGLLIVMSYNWLMFNGFNLQGGYEAYVNRPLDGQALSAAAAPGMALNVAGTFVSGSRGLLVLTPLLFIVIPGLRSAWRLAPWWVRASAVSGIAYTAVQLQIQSGAEGFLAGNLIYAYRYVLEGLFLCCASACCGLPRVGARSTFARTRRLPAGGPLSLDPRRRCHALRPDHELSVPSLARVVARCHFGRLHPARAGPRVDPARHGAGMAVASAHVRPASCHQAKKCRRRVDVGNYSASPAST